ncbi:MAG: hypothetical protein HZB53_02500 [Chloroflexi bacterium]|nr:hypothetical protein [Chloroflexota bacterium]
MLDLSVVIAQMTQGQPAAPMTPLGTGAAAAGEAAAPAQAPAGGAPASTPTGGAAAAPVDARAVADRVYELMRRDLLVHQERTGGR